MITYVTRSEEHTSELQSHTHTRRAEEEVSLGHNDGIISEECMISHLISL